MVEKPHSWRQKGTGKDKESGIESGISSPVRFAFVRFCFPFKCGGHFPTQQEVACSTPPLQHLFVSENLRRQSSPLALRRLTARLAALTANASVFLSRSRFVFVLTTLTDSRVDKRSRVRTRAGGEASLSGDSRRTGAVNPRVNQRIERPQKSIHHRPRNSVAVRNDHSSYGKSEEMHRPSQPEQECDGI